VIFTLSPYRSARDSIFGSKPDRDHIGVPEIDENRLRRMENLLLEAAAVYFNHRRTPFRSMMLSVDRSLKQIEIDHFIVLLMFNPLMFFKASMESIDTLFDPDQRGWINLILFFPKDHRPKRVSNETDVPHERVSEKRIAFVDHSPAFQ
jgi:hypothetical protein